MFRYKVYRDICTNLIRPTWRIDRQFIRMSDFDDFDDKNLFSDTFDLLEDIKAAGYDLKKSKFFNTPIEKIFDSPFFTRNRNRARGESSTRRFPTFSSNSSKKSTSTTESSETDSGDELFHSRAFRRSDSTYSTSSHDTTSSGETASDASSTRSNPRKVNVTRQIPVQHFVTSSKNYQPGIPKKSENEVLKDERHSMPYKLYSHQENEANERTQAMSPTTEIPVSERDGVSRFPSPLSKSTELQNKPEASASQRDRKLNPPELCSVTRYGQSKSLPDVLKTDRMAVPPNVPKVGCEKGEQPSWDERQGRIEGALKWLRAELVIISFRYVNFKLTLFYLDGICKFEYVDFYGYFCLQNLFDIF